MERITILATASTLRNVLSALGRTAAGLVDLRSRWRDTDLTLMSLESQLAALRTALTQIKDWTEAAQSVELHSQLVMDLDRCIACCRLLISKIDADLLHVQTIADRVDVASRFKLLLKSRDFKKTQSMIGQKTVALTLLLTVCNSAAISQQHELLQRPQNRRVFQDIENDTSSLFVNPQADSFMTSSSSAPTFASPSMHPPRYELEKELFVSNIYGQWAKNPSNKPPAQQQPRRRMTTAETTDKFSMDRISSQDKFIAPSRNVVETREKFIVDTIETGDKFYVEDSSGMIETREKFITNTMDSANSFTAYETPDMIGPRNNFISSSTWDDDHDTGTLSSSSSTLVSSRTPSTQIKDKWKSSLRRIPPTRKSESMKRSIAIDNALKQESRRVQPEYKALLIGSESRINILTAVTADRKKRTSQELADFKSNISKRIVEYTHMLIKEIRRVQIDPGAKYLWAYVDLIGGYNSDTSVLDDKFFDALESILQNALISDLVRLFREEDLLPKSAEYFFTQVPRISQHDYVPNELDIYYATTTSTGLYKAELWAADELRVDLLDIGGLSGKRKKWIHHFEDAKFIIFVVDLDQCEQEDKLVETMQLLNGIVNSRWFTRSSIILLMNISSPAPGQNNNGSEVLRAAEYVLKRFEELRLGRLFVCPCNTANGGAVIQLVLSTMKEAILTEALQEGKMLL